MDLKDLRPYVDDRPAEGVFRVHRDVYSDRELFELEQKFVFERTWNFLGLESQFAQPHDYITGAIGKTPVLVTRDARGRIGGFLNVCRHKGAMVCGAEQGNAKHHVCPYHGWTYDSSGKNVDIKDRKTACYPEAFDAESHDLLPLARVASYKGLVFGSLSEEVPPLEDFLGDMCVFLDLVVEQGPNGVECIPGRAVYTYRGNWKLQMDNGVDPYHLTTTHLSYIGIQQRRRSGAGNIEARQYDWAKRTTEPGGTFAFPYGHSAVWNNQPEPEKRPIYPALGEVRKRVGDTRADWMLKLRNIEVFPNMQIADAITLMLRTFHPIAVDRTEMRSYCLAPIGEAPELRAWRLRQFEDFFNPGGMATPDDTVVYESCQRGMAAKSLSFLQGFSRGIAAVRDGVDDAGRALGIRAASSSVAAWGTFTEVGFHPPYREWARLMEAGLAGRKAYP
jgi:phenylpropionate dioxygenase-like ring-hydroxylating dioxygenase large terminal subunit